MCLHNVQFLARNVSLCTNYEFEVSTLKNFLKAWCAIYRPEYYFYKKLGYLCCSGVTLKIHIEFLQIGILPRSGMHKGWGGGKQLLHSDVPIPKVGDANNSKNAMSSFVGLSWN